jgi:hypothetical protein
VRSYLVITGVVFALIVAAHLLRVVSEGVQLLREPVFDLLTLLAAGLSAWAWRLALRRAKAPGAS